MAFVSNTDSFLNKLESGFYYCTGEKFNSSLKIGLGVSGGADSVSLLHGFSILAHRYNFKIFVLSVNHNIRERTESYGDVCFVENLCERLKNNKTDISFKKIEIEPEKILTEASSMKKSIEEVARKERYSVFDGFIKENNLDFFCLAHNQNDNLETIVMRFLQGSGIQGSCGIPFKREKFIRPMLNISRAEIEGFLNEIKSEWRNDSTNSDENYLRNRVRHSLIPMLDEKFNGWKKAVVKGAEKARIDDDFFSSHIENFSIERITETAVKIPFDEFSKLHQALQIRLLQKSLNLINCENRISWSVMKNFTDSFSDGKIKFSQEFEGIEFVSDGSFIYVKNRDLIATETGFFVIIKEDGVYELPFGNAFVKVCNNKAEVILEGSFCSVEIKNVFVPFCIRSHQMDDFLETSSKGKKAVSDFYSDVHVKAEDKDKIPLVEELIPGDYKIVAVAGKLLGYDDWILRGY